MGSSKKKKSHRDDNDDHDPHHHAVDPAPKPKLPTIKLSLRLPGHIPAAGTSSASSLSAPPSTSSSSINPKKRRAPPQDESDDEADDDEELDIGSPRSSKSYHHHSYRRQEEDDDTADLPSSFSHKKKKKHKHKHRHKHDKHGRHKHHSNHDRMGAEEEEGDEEEEDLGDETTVAAAPLPPSLPTKLKIRLGSSSSKNNAPATSTPTDHTPVRKEHSRSRSLSTNQTPLVHIKQEEDEDKEISSMAQYPYEDISHVHPAPAPETQHHAYGQKKPFAAIAQQQQHQQDEDGTDQDDNQGDEEEDDMLGGDLDEPEDDADDDGVASDDEDSVSLMSPTSDRSRAGSRSRSLGGSGVATPTSGLTATGTGGKTTKVRASSKGASRGGDGDDVAGGTTASAASKASRSSSTKRIKTSSKRQTTPKPYTPAPPKRKNVAQVCHKLLDGLFRKDHYSLFSAPVDLQAVPDYALIIKHPMDLSTMRSKVDRGFYPKLDLFLEDFKLICDNCKLYNAPDTLYYKQAQKLWEWGSKVIEKERKAIQDIEEELAKLQQQQYQLHGHPGAMMKEEETLDVDGLGDQLPQQQPLLHHLHQHQYSYQQPQQIQQPPLQHPIQNSYSRNPIMSVEEALDSPTPMGADTISSSMRTPQQYRRSKRVKYKRDGTIQLSYSTDGSIDPNSHPDPWSLVPLGREYGAAPMVTPIYDFRNPPQQPGGARAPASSSSSSSASTGNANTNTLFQVYLDDYPYFRMPEVNFMPASYLDYGMYPVAGVASHDVTSSGSHLAYQQQMQQQAQSSSSSSSSSLGQKQQHPYQPQAPKNIPAYTGMIFGDETGEAYVRSMASFLEGIVGDSNELNQLPEDEQQGLLAVKTMIVDKVARLTHGSSLIAEQVAQVLRRKNTAQSKEVEALSDSMEIDGVVKKEEDKDDEEMKHVEHAVLLDLRPYSFGNTESAATHPVKQEEKAASSMDVDGGDDAAKMVNKEEGQEQQGQQQPDVEMEEAKGAMEEKKEEIDEAKVGKPIPGLINVEQLIRALEVWPDFDAWRRLKIELDCLVPPAAPPPKPSSSSDTDKDNKNVDLATAKEEAGKQETKDGEPQRGADAAAGTTSTDAVKEEDKSVDSAADKKDKETVDEDKKKEEEDLKVQWGVSWPASSDPEEAEQKKKWVGEYLAQNAADMREVLRILSAHNTKAAAAAKTLSSTSTAAPTATTASTPAPLPPTTTPTPATATVAPHLKELNDKDREAVERAVASIRKRLIKMAQYVPLSQINPEKLPPPPPRPVAAPAKVTPAAPVPAPTSLASTPVPASSSTSASASASTSAAGTPAATTPSSAPANP